MSYSPDSLPSLVVYKSVTQLMFYSTEIIVALPIKYFKAVFSMKYYTINVLFHKKIAAVTRSALKIILIMCVL